MDDSRQVLALATLEQAPPDPIFGLVQDYLQDAREKKVNLTVGAYVNERGNVAPLEATTLAQKVLQERLEGLRRSDKLSVSYQPMTGNPEFVEAVRKLVFGENSDCVKDQRIASIQTLGGTGALATAARLVRYHRPASNWPKIRAYVSDPTWGNHIGIFEDAGFEVERYPYYDRESHQIKFQELIGFVQSMQKGSVMVLHGCCHNPTGADLSLEQWQELGQQLRETEITPVIDLAYQGFGSDLEDDVCGVRAFVDAGLEFFVAQSFSKSMAFYRERVGALHCHTESQQGAQNIISQLKQRVRRSWSNSPFTGAALAAVIFSDQELHELWKNELDGMKNRIAQVREEFASRMAEKGYGEKYDFVKAERGMFSLLPKFLSTPLREKYGVYLVGSGRVCFAAMNESNLPYICNSIAEVESQA